MVVNFNPRSPHGERRCRHNCEYCYARFQSTLPARGATRQPQANRHVVDISIHAPRTGSDAADADVRHFAHISIHAPRTGSDTAS